MSLHRRALLHRVAALAAAQVICATIALAQEAWSYRDKTVTIFVATSPGGGYDFYGRLLARHIGKFLPGNPQVIVKNMPGAGGIVLANYLAQRAARDGTEIGTFEHGTAFATLLNGTAIQFHALKLGWLGSLDQFVPIVAVWHTVPIHSADDLLIHPMTVGSSVAGSTTAGYPNSLNAILGTKIKVISGYAGSGASCNTTRSLFWETQSGFSDLAQVQHQLATPSSSPDGKIDLGGGELRLARFLDLGENEICQKQKIRAAVLDPRAFSAIRPYIRT
jgi:hypothetical protein